MQDASSEPPLPSLPPKEEARLTAHIHLLLWEERLIAAHSGDTRLEATLEHGSDFYERVAALCLRKSVHALTEEERELGHVLALAGNRGLGKRFIASRSPLSPVHAQELLNQYYAIFYKVREWLKRNSAQIITAQIDVSKEESLRRCIAQLPQDWLHTEALTFSLPSYIYEPQAEKFFRHHFEREELVGERLVRLPVNVEFRPSGG